MKKYFEAQKSADYSTAYDCLDIENTGLTSKSCFEKVMKANGNNENVTNVSIQQEKKSSGKFNKIYDVTYTTKGNSEEKNMTVTLVKQKAKKFLFFDSYKVSPQDLILDNVNITVPKGAEVTVDGSKIPASDISKDEETTSSTVDYTVSDMFVGKHDISVTAPFMEPISETDELADDAQLDFSEFKLSQDSIDTIKKLGANIVKEFYQDALDKKNFSAISSEFDQDDKDALSDMQYRYESLVSSFSYYSDTEKVTLGDVDNVSYGTLNSDDGIECSAEFNLNYTYASTGIFDYSGDSYYDATVYFVYKDGNWKITEVN